MYLKGLRPIKLTYDFYCKKSLSDRNSTVILVWSSHGKEKKESGMSCK